MVELSISDVLAIVLALVAFVIALVAFFRANPNATPAAVDTEVSRRFAEMQANRELVERLERAYQQNNENTQRMFDAFVGALRFLAPLTPNKADDAALELLTDIQQPGEPEAAG